MMRFGRGITIVALGLAVAACTGKGPSRFGAVLPLSGAAEVYGKSIRQGIELAYEQVKADSEAPKVELQVVDSKSDPPTAHDMLDRVYADGALAAIGGITSAEALAMVEVADSRRRILLSPSASLPQLSGISENFFRVYPSDFSEGTVMSRYAFDELKVRTGVILAKEETYAKGIQTVFAEEFQRRGGKILETIEFPAGTTDFAALADRTVTLKPDFVYLAAYADEIARLVAQLHAHQFNGLILTTSSFAAAETIASVRDQGEGIYFTQTSFTTQGKDLAPHVRAFVDAFEARWKKEPDIYAAHGYDAFMILVEAVRQGGDSTTSFWKGMRNIHEYPGVTGALQFDDRGDVQKFPHVYTVTDGRAIDVEEQKKQRIEAAREEMRRLEEELRRLKNQGN